MFVVVLVQDLLEYKSKNRATGLQRGNSGPFVTSLVILGFCDFTICNVGWFLLHDISDGTVIAPFDIICANTK